MKTLKRLSKKASEFCELCGYDPAKVRENMEKIIDEVYSRFIAA